jgi:hypothetical protein
MKIATDLLLLSWLAIGMGLIGWGLWLIYPPICFICGGAFVSIVPVGFILQQGKKK